MQSQRVVVTLILLNVGLVLLVAARGCARQLYVRPVTRPGAPG